MINFDEMHNRELIQKAASIIKSKRVGDSFIGDVGCALISEKNNVYLGVCADVGSNSFCAEQFAIGAMITAGEYTIKKIVAVWIDQNNSIYIVSPCGNCRQFMFQIDEKNLFAEVIVEEDKSVPLRKLLPYATSFSKCETACTEQ